MDRLIRCNITQVIRTPCHIHLSDTTSIKTPFPTILRPRMDIYMHSIWDQDHQGVLRAKLSVLTGNSSFSSVRYVASAFAAHVANLIQRLNLQR